MHHGKNIFITGNAQNDARRLFDYLQAIGKQAQQLGKSTSSPLMQARENLAGKRIERTYHAIAERNKQELEQYLGNNALDALLIELTGETYNNLMQIGLCKEQQASYNTYFHQKLFLTSSGLLTRTFRRATNIRFLTPPHNIGEKKLWYGFVYDTKIAGLRNKQLFNQQQHIWTIVCINQAVAKAITHSKGGDRILEHIATIRSKANHDWYHHLIEFEDDRGLNHDEFIGGNYANSYELHCAKIHYDIFQLAYQNEPSLKENLRKDAEQFAQLLDKASLNESNKAYLLRQYCYPLCRIVDIKQDDRLMHYYGDVLQQYPDTNEAEFLNYLYTGAPLHITRTKITKSYPELYKILSNT